MVVNEDSLASRVRVVDVRDLSPVQRHPKFDEWVMGARAGDVYRVAPGHYIVKLGVVTDLSG